MLLALNHKTNANEVDVRKVVEAAYKQTGTEKHVKNYAKRIEKRYIPDELKPYASWTFHITKAAIERKIEYKWTF